MKKYSKPICEYVEFELMDDILAASGESGASSSRWEQIYEQGKQTDEKIKEWWNSWWPW